MCDGVGEVCSEGEESSTIVQTTQNLEDPKEEKITNFVVPRGDVYALCMHAVRNSSTANH